MVKLRNILTEIQRKTLTVFDWDDTLVKSDAKTKVTHSNGTVTYLTAGEYAGYKAKPGDEFDFSEFHGPLINPRTIEKYFSKFRAIIKNGGDVVILTARGTKKPIEDWLKNFSISVPIIALNNNDPKAKSGWIENQIDRYTNIYFYDDSLKNTKAVGQLSKKYPEKKIKSFRVMESKNNTFNDIFKKKNKWLELISKNQLEDVKNNLYVLVQNAYAPLGGNVSIKNPNDVLSRNYWEAVDDDIDPDADAVIFGKKQNGIKIGGIGHDGSSKSKSDLINKLALLLNKSGYWIEASGKVAEILRGKGLKTIKDIEKLKKIFPYSHNFIWVDKHKGIYKRDLENGIYTEEESVFGNPKI